MINLTPAPPFYMRSTMNDIENNLIFNGHFIRIFLSSMILARCQMLEQNEIYGEFDEISRRWTSTLIGPLS